jgi:hypothetical protein
MTIKFSKSTKSFYETDFGGNIPDDAVDVPAETHSEMLAWREKGKNIEGDERGFPMPVDLPSPSFEQVAAQKKAFLQKYMDAQAQARNYDDIATAITYADEPAVPRFQAEGQTFRAWRSLVWDRCYGLLEQALSEEIPIPTDVELIELLPALELPS